jgi:hypothetical protein
MLQDRAYQRAQSLRAELKAIELWDNAYWRSSQREWWETVAFESRQQRRSEIVAELVTLGQGVKGVPNRMFGFRNTKSTSYTEEA